MTIKTVEAYCGGELLAKRTILFGVAEAITSDDFIALAGHSMADQGIPANVVDRWIVREPRVGE